MAENVLSAPPVQTEPEPTPERPNPWLRVARLFLRQREASIVVVAIALIIYFQFSNQAFLSTQNIRTLSQFVAATAIISAGEVMLLICGEIDLSVGQVYALAPFIMYFANQAGLPLLVGLILGLIVCALVGLFNGLITVMLKVPSFITTLGTLFLINGLTLTISQGFPVLTPSEGLINEILGHASYSEIIWAIAITIVMQVVLSWTRWGLHTVATGGNLLGASEVGVNVARIKIGNFMLCSVLGGFAGILEAFRITSIDPLAGGTDIMFMAVAGAVIGGTALTGGLGTIVGAFLGTLVLSILRDGFTLLGVSAFTFDIILGAAILVAMILNVRLRLWREAGRE
ncbi:ABC transporter permease [Thermogemmatispora tikiterensis]|uniref:ABC transporter permease n=1 Tax=Thermogemmatispora tikiterensis TaxID=1825093 RepID=UPI000DDAFDB2|nr:ABC transporter permease [Thermogemmatispora tikiterensis]